MKKFSRTVCLSLLTLSSAAFAHTNHFYLGADAGIFNANFNNSYFDQTTTIPANGQVTVTQNGYTGGLLLGFTRAITKKYFMGLEASGNLDSSYANYSAIGASTNFSDKTQINGHVDLDAVPGIKLAKTIFAYAKLGLSIGWLQDNLTSPANNNVNLPVTTNYVNHNTEIGLAAGLGVAKSVSKHVNLFSEADYHDYGSVQFQNFQNFAATYTHSTKVTAYDVVIGADYKFV